MVRMEKGVGEFVIEETPLASLAGKQPDEDVIRKVNSAYTTGRYRTVQQDAATGIGRIVDIALKALSPGINDNTTATICLDHLGAIVVRLAPRPIESPDLYAGGEVRVIYCGKSYRDFISEAFDQIRQNAEDKPAVLARLLNTLAVVARQTKDPDRLEPLREQAEAVVQAAERSIPSAPDRLGVQAALERFSLALGESNRREK